MQGKALWMNNFTTQSKHCAWKIMELLSPITALSPSVKQLICSVGYTHTTSTCTRNLTGRNRPDGWTGSESQEVGVGIGPVQAVAVGKGIGIGETESSNSGDPYFHANGSERLQVAISPMGRGDTESGNDADPYFQASRLELRIDSLASLLPASDDSSAGYFEAAVTALAPVFSQCQRSLRTAGESDIESQLLPRLQWTHSEKILCGCLEMMRKHSTVDAHDNILTLLLVSSVFERALGNVYLLTGCQCPSMLKDLLVTEELADTLGVSVIKLLRVLIGPPVSLNLRNVAWHGFLGDHELSDRYSCFLLLLAAAIGDILTHKGLVAVPQRVYVAWIPDVLDRMPTASSGLKDPINLHFLKRVLEESSLIQPQTEKQWLLVFDLYVTERFGYCLALLLPLFEHCLRRVFATVNACPERVLTAESSVLYTTFNEMLEQTLPDGSVNSLPEFLTNPCMDLLQDMLFYPDGPRVRDHLSHGEVDLSSVDERVVFPFLCVAAWLAHRQQESHSAFENTVAEGMVGTVESYRSVFHPVAVLQHKFADLLHLLEGTEDCVQLSADLEVLGETKEVCQENPLLTRTLGVISSLGQCPPFDMRLDEIETLSQQHFPTLFRWQTEEASRRAGCSMRESEFVRLLLRIVEEMATGTRQVHCALQQRQQQWVAKTLRSRQRENLKKLLLCVPCIQVLMSRLTALVGWNITLLSDFPSADPHKCRALQRLLKVTLQHCENVRTLTSPDKNKWTESVELLLQLLPKGHTLLHHWQQ